MLTRYINSNGRPIIYDTVARAVYSIRYLNDQIKKSFKLFDATPEQVAHMVNDGSLRPIEHKPHESDAINATRFVSQSVQLESKKYL